MRTRFGVTVGLVVLGLVVWGGAPALADVINAPTTFAVADALDGTVDGTYNVAGDLLITSTGSITCNDPATPAGASACPIKIVVTGNLLMEAGSEITADNTVGGGNAGNITITVGTDMTMCGPNGGQPGCLATGIPGALISAQKKSGRRHQCRQQRHDHGRGQGDRDRRLLHGGRRNDLRRRDGREDHHRQSHRQVRQHHDHRREDLLHRARLGRPGGRPARARRRRTGRQDLHRLRLRADQPGARDEQGPGSGRRPRPSRVLRGADPRGWSSRPARATPPTPRTAATSSTTASPARSSATTRPTRPAASRCGATSSRSTRSTTAGPASSMPTSVAAGPSGTSWIDIFAFSELTVIDGTGNDSQQRRHATSTSRPTPCTRTRWTAPTTPRAWSRRRSRAAR